MKKDNRSVYYEIYNALVDSAEAYKLKKISATKYNRILEAAYDYCIEKFRDGTINKQWFNKLADLINSYKGVK